MSLLVLSLVLLSVGAWVGVFRATVEHPLDGMALLLYLTAYQFLFRPLVLAVGIDDPFPTDVFAGRDVSGLMVTTQLLVLLWFGALVIGNRFCGPASRLFSIGVPRPPRSISSTRLVRVSIVLTTVAAAVTLSRWSQFGGFEGLVQAHV